MSKEMSSSEDLFLPKLDFQNVYLPEFKSFCFNENGKSDKSSNASNPGCNDADSLQDDLHKFKDLGFEDSQNDMVYENALIKKQVRQNYCPDSFNEEKNAPESFNEEKNCHIEENADFVSNDCTDSNANNVNSQSVIGHQIIPRLTGLDDIAGLDDVKQSLREAIVYPTKYPQLFRNGRTVWSRALLYGAPGVGKTTIAHAIAAEAQIPLYQVTSADLTSPWIGQSEKLVRQIFTTLGHKRCILFLDEVDSLCKTRTSSDTNHCRRMSTELLIQIQNFEGSAMFILCASNCPWDIDPAFLRRFQKRIYVPLPDTAAREKLILSNIENNLTTAHGWKEFLTATNDLTGSDLKNIARAAMMIPLGEMQSAEYWMETIDGKMTPCDMNNPRATRCKLDIIPNWKVWCRSLCIKDLWTALKKTDKSITDKDIKRFVEFKNEHAV